MVRRLWTTGVMIGFMLLGWLLLAQPVAQASSASAQSLTQTVTTTVTTTVPSAAIAPILIDRYPQQPYFDSLRPNISLTFDQPMNRGSIAAALRIEPPFPFRLSVYGTSVSIEPRQSLMPDVTYQFTLERTATAANGTPLAQEYR
ncbi:MAG: Ig-like domain-containing protein, partial [Caldilineaceae bacterium]